MNYYYFGATLPMLSVEEPPPMSVADFIGLCSEHLAAEDFDCVKALAEDPWLAGGGFAEDWRAWETQLRNFVARSRAARLHRDAAPYLREERVFDAGLEGGVADAFSRSTPLDRERALDVLRWKKIEELGGFNPFSVDAMMSYVLHLAIAARWASMDPAVGREKVNELVKRPPAGGNAIFADPEPVTA